MIADALAGGELGIGLDADLGLVHAHHFLLLAGPDADGDAQCQPEDQARQGDEEADRYDTCGLDGEAGGVRSKATLPVT